jgi:hypothetical protein
MIRSFAGVRVVDVGEGVGVLKQILFLLLEGVNIFMGSL